MTWDDHEVENDYADQWSAHIDTQPADFLKRRAAAYQAYYEHMPLRRASLPRGPDMRVYDRFRFGNLVETPILDGRQYRDMGACPNATPTGRGGHVVASSCADLDDPKRSMLDQAQEKWLIDGFRRSDARWNVVAQDLLMAGFIQQGRDGVVGHWTDGWDGYRACRARILEAMRDTRLSNPVVIGGDSHCFWTTDLKVDFDRQTPTVATEFGGGSISAESPPYQPFADYLPRNPHIRYFESRQHGYVSVEVTPEAMHTRFMSVDRLRKDAPATVLAAFQVESGKPGAVAA
jgi:alkaline phosphatase D